MSVAPPGSMLWRSWLVMWSMGWLLVGCGSGDDGQGTGQRACPTDPSANCVHTIGDGASCVIAPATDAGNQRETTCQCQSGFLVCNSCPSVYGPPPNGGACTPGDYCDWNSWEHGCSCGCGSSGTWHCTPETIGTTECRDVDAGV